MTREEKKLKKYLEELVSGGYVSSFSCDRTFWEVGHKSREFLQHLSQQSLNLVANFNVFMFVMYWWKRFSTIEQDIMLKLSSENFQNCHLINHGDLDKLFDFDIQGQVH